MLVVISPAKKLNMKSVNNLKETQPSFSNNINELIDIARGLTVGDLENLMRKGIDHAMSEDNKD